MRSRLRRLAPFAAAFFLPAALFLAVCAAGGIGFGGRPLLIQDLYSQYLPFLGYLQNLPRQGNDLFYTLSATLGGNMSGLFATYLGSPIDTLVFLFPQSALPGAVLTIIAVKIGLCGLAMYTLLRRAGQGWATLIFSTAYALMGYVTAYFFNLMWLDGVWLLPLVALGIQRLVAGQHMTAYLLALAAALAFNYYTGYMLCIFSILFFGYTCWLVPPAERGRGWFWPRAWRFAVASLAAAGLAAIVLAPAFFSLTGTKSTFDASRFAFTEAFALPDLFRMLLTGAHGATPPVNNMPFIFTGAAITALATLFFLNGAISRQERLASGALLAIILASFHIAPLNLVWHAFNLPSSFPFRAAFVVGFLLIWLAYRCYLHLSGLRPAHLIGVAAVFGWLCLGITDLPLAARYGEALLMIACCALLYGLATRPRRFLLWALALLQCGQLLLNGTLVLHNLQGFTEGDPAGFRARHATGTAILSELQVRDPDLYRIEMPGLLGTGNVYGTNSGMLLGYPGIAHFSSVQRTDVLSLLRSLGYATNSGSAVYQTTQTPDAVDSLLGVRYLVNDAPLPHKQYNEAFTMDDLTVYENVYALPLAFAVSPAVLTEELSAEDPFAAANEIYAALLGEEETHIFLPLDGADEPTLENAAAETEDGVTRYTAASKIATVTFAGMAASNGPAFAWLPPDRSGLSGVELFSENRQLEGFHTLSDNDIFPLGDYAPEDAVALTARLEPEGALTLRDGATLYQEDLTAFDDVYATLAAGGATLTKRSSSHLSGAVTLPEERPYLLLTLPYDTAWRISVDGQPVEPQPAFGALMAVEIGPGAHTLDLRYIPSGFGLGAAFSGLTTLLLVGWTALHRRRSPHHSLPISNNRRSSPCRLPLARTNRTSGASSPR